jgi:hypothetical protein
VVGETSRPESSEVLTVLIDCDTCAARGPACGDCVVTVLLGPPEWIVEGPGGPGGPSLQPAETAALAVLAESGLVPPLRLVPPTAADTPGDGGRAAV